MMDRQTAGCPRVNVACHPGSQVGLKINNLKYTCVGSVTRGNRIDDTCCMYTVSDITAVLMLGHGYG